MSVDIVKLFQEPTQLTLPMLAMYRDCIYPAKRLAPGELLNHVTAVFFCNSLNERDAFEFNSGCKQTERSNTFVVKLTGRFDTEHSEGHAGFVVDKIGDHAVTGSEKPILPISIKTTDLHGALLRFRFAKVLLGKEKAYIPEDHPADAEALGAAAELLLTNSSLNVEMTFTAWGRIVSFVVS